MRCVYALIFAAACGCGSVGSDLFGDAGRGGAGGKTGASSSSASGTSQEASSGAGGDGATSSGNGGSSQSSSVASSTSSSSGSPALFWASGVQIDLSIASLTGWTQCFVDSYADDVSLLAQTLANCGGGKMLLACRKNGDQVLHVAAMADEKDVTFNTPLDGTVHIANGAGWYFNTSGGWGFLPSADSFVGAGCDFVGSTLDPSPPGIDANKRLCWNMHPIHFQYGFRCGETDINTAGVDFVHSYERLIFKAP